MNSAIDPVCGMTVDPATAAGQSTWEGTTWYFCSDDCKRAFDANPAKYAKGKAAAGKGKGIPTPRYGSAGSGGLEFEPGPEKD